MSLLCSSTQGVAGCPSALLTSRWRRLGEEADVAVSAHTLRHSCLTNLVRRGHDLVLVAEIAGHKRLETTRRYSLPTSGTGKPPSPLRSGAS